MDNCYWLRQVKDKFCESIGAGPDPLCLGEPIWSSLEGLREEEFDRVKLVTCSELSVSRRLSDKVAQEKLTDLSGRCIVDDPPSLAQDDFLIFERRDKRLEIVFTRYLLTFPDSLEGRGNEANSYRAINEVELYGKSNHKLEGHVSFTFGEDISIIQILIGDPLNVNFQSLFERGYDPNYRVQSISDRARDPDCCVDEAVSLAKKLYENVMGM